MVDTPVKEVSIDKLEPLEGTIVKLPPVSGDAVNAFKLNPYVAVSYTHLRAHET